MAHSTTNLLTHIIFSTKDRQPFLVAELRPRLYAYLGGIVRELDGQALGIGGTADHVHLLIKLPPTVSIADAARVLKANSSKWLHEKWPARRRFAWQTGYGAFSVSESGVPATLGYIARQAEHHKKTTFQKEFLQFLKKHRIPYDERYLWR
jgi:putative transposase